MAQASTRGNRAAPSGSTATRGVIVVVVALVVGVLLIVKGGGGAAVGEDPNAAIDGTTTTQADGGPTTTEATSATSVPPADLKIIVANGSNISGLAGRTKDQLAAASYPAVIATDATADAATSIVFFVAGFEADATAVAAALGMPPERLSPMPDPANVPVASIEGVQVVVVLGPDAPNAAGAGATTTVAP